MPDAPDATLASRVRRRPWVFSLGFAALVLVAQVALLIGQDSGADDLAVLAPAWQEVAVIPVAFLFIALVARVAIAAVVRLTTRRPGDVVVRRRAQLPGVLRSGCERPRS